MEVDSYFRIGKHHSMCQDYAVAGHRGGVPFAMLSDGCSGVVDPLEPGSPHTDFGSRFLVRAAMQRLPALVEGMLPWLPIVGDAWDMAQAAHLPKNSMDATLIAAVPMQGRRARVCQTGDGVVAYKTRAGCIRYISTSFGENAPYYLSYLLKPQLLSGYFNHVREVILTTNNFEPGVGWGVPTVVSKPIDDFPICQNIVIENPAIVLCFSDGIESFHSGHQQVPLEQVLDQIFAFKSTRGEFLSRRCHSFLTRFCPERGWWHADDFSAAGICLE